MCGPNVGGWLASGIVVKRRDTQEEVRLHCPLGHKVRSAYRTEVPQLSKAGLEHRQLVFALEPTVRIGYKFLYQVRTPITCPAAARLPLATIGATATQIPWRHGSHQSPHQMPIYDCRLLPHAISIGQFLVLWGKSIYVMLAI
jgi:hypothetical protein